MKLYLLTTLTFSPPLPMPPPLSHLSSAHLPSHPSPHHHHHHHLLPSPLDEVLNSPRGTLQRDNKENKNSTHRPSVTRSHAYAGTQI